MPKPTSYSLTMNKLYLLHIAPLVVVFTKFDGLIVQESGKLNDIEDDGVKWNMARKNADITLQRAYLPKVFETKCPPKAYVCLEGENNEHYLLQDRNYVFWNRYGHARK